MIKRQFELMEYNLRKEKIRQVKKGIDTNTFAALLQLLGEAKELLFDNTGKYRKIKIFQFKRIWNLAKITIRLINTLMAVFGIGKKEVSESDLTLW